MSTLLEPKWTLESAIGAFCTIAICVSFAAGLVVGLIGRFL